MPHFYHGFDDYQALLIIRHLQADHTTIWLSQSGFNDLFTYQTCNGAGAPGAGGVWSCEGPEYGSRMAETELFFDMHRYATHQTLNNLGMQWDTNFSKYC